MATLNPVASSRNRLGYGTSAVFLAGAIAALLSGTAAAQPANDSCAAPQAIEGFRTTYWNSAGATTDGPVECRAMYNDVWFCWTAPHSGPTIADTCGGPAFDSVIAVYEGCGCPSGPSAIACNDDFCAGLSRVTFSAVAGRAYTIRIGAFGIGGNSAGMLTIHSGVIGPIHYDTNGHDYYLSPVAGFNAGEELAVSLGGHLATVNNIEENEFLRVNVLGIIGGDERGWIGFYDPDGAGNFVWTSGEPVNFTHWVGGGPAPRDAERWGQMLAGTGEWTNGPSENPLTRFALIEVAGPPPPCPGDWDRSGRLDSQDLFAFLTDFFAGIPAADFNRDGATDSGDFFAFIVAFFAGC